MISPSTNEPIASAFSALPAAIDWVSQLLIGHVGTSIAVLAVAWVGMTLLQGRMLVRDGLRVILGCFILFGAPVIARGFMTAIRGDQHAALKQTATAVPPPVLPSKPPQFDPYAGASVPHQ